MRPDIHPEWYPEAKMTCISCGTVWTIGATKPEVRVDICSNCHPFYTGEMRIVDTEGQVDRFMKRLQARDDIRREAEERDAAQRSPDTTLEELGLNARVINSLTDAEVVNAGQLMDMLAEGDQTLLDIQGFGRQALADVKKSLRGRGFVLPEDQPEDETESEAAPA